MAGIPFKFKSKVWVYDGPAPWHFVTLPRKLSAQIKKDFGGGRPGFGSVKVRVTLGKTSWSTSLFPDTKLGAYVLPLKAAVRKKEGVAAGETRGFLVEVEV